MNNINPTIKIVISSILLSLLTMQVTAAGRGEPNSSNRSSWCDSKLTQCKSDAEDDCTSFEGTLDNVCLFNETLSCESAYASTSNCRTRPRETTRPIKPKLSPTPQAKQPLKPVPSIKNKNIRKHIKPKFSTIRK